MINGIISFIIALVSGMGLGGGGLFAVYLSVFTDTPQLSVQGFNLLFFIFCAGASVIVQLFKRKINFFAVLIMTLAGIVGALLGTLLAGVMPEEWLRKIFGVMLISAGMIALRTAMSGSNNSEGEEYSKNISTKETRDSKKTTERNVKSDK